MLGYDLEEGSGDLSLNPMEKDNLGFEDIMDTSVKMNPNFYIHTAILFSQKILTLSVANKGNINEGLIGYNILIEQMETIARASGLLNQVYDDTINNFKQSSEYLNDTTSMVRTSKLCNKKLELVLESVFSRAPLKGCLRGGVGKNVEGGKVLKEPLGESPPEEMATN